MFAIYMMLRIFYIILIITTVVELFTTKTSKLYRAFTYGFIISCVLIIGSLGTDYILFKVLLYTGIVGYITMYVARKIIVARENKK